MAIDIYTLSGTPISTVPSRLDYGSIYAHDMFLVSKHVLSNVLPDRTYECNGTLYTNEFYSQHITYACLSDQIYGDIVPRFGLKSMAWECSSHYSRQDHIHNYTATFISVDPQLELKLDKSNADNLSTIAEFIIDDKSIIISMPSIHMYEYSKPYIGQLKFMAVSRIEPIDEHSTKFNGWVYPDGRALLSDEFPDAWEAFGTSYGYNKNNRTFNIPALSSFIKFANASTQQDCKSKVAGQNCLLAHNHVLKDLTVKGSITTHLKVNLTTQDSGNAAIHNGKGKTKKVAGILKFDMKDLSCAAQTMQPSDSQLNRETYPAYNMLPVLMYIGERKN